jgi:hypothetical protein
MMTMCKAIVHITTRVPILTGYRNPITTKVPGTALILYGLPASLLPSLVFDLDNHESIYYA